MDKKEVVISSSALNSYGFRVLTDGIDLSQYKRNPILLWMHNRPYLGRKDEVLPLGTVENLRMDGDKLIGTPVFDEKDEFAMQIKQKWDAGILKMVSAGLEVVEKSEDPSVVLQGQRYPTVTKSKLIEVSIVDIGANDEAIALLQDGKMVCLSAGALDKMNFLNPINNNLNNIHMKEIALKLGLAENATQEQVMTAIDALQVKANEAVQLRQEQENQRKQAIVAEVEEAVKLHRITAEKKAMFVEMGDKIGLAQLKETFSLMQPAQGPSSIITPQSQGASEYKKLSDVPSDKIAALRESDFTTYARLYKEEYGVEVSKEN